MALITRQQFQAAIEEGIAAHESVGLALRPFECEALREVGRHALTATRALSRNCPAMQAGLWHGGMLTFAWTFDKVTADLVVDDATELEIV